MSITYRSKNEPRKVERTRSPHNQARARSGNRKSSIVNLAGRLLTGENAVDNLGLNLSRFKVHTDLRFDRIEAIATEAQRDVRQVLTIVNNLENKVGKLEEKVDKLEEKVDSIKAKWAKSKHYSDKLSRIDSYRWGLRYRARVVLKSRQTGTDWT